MRTLLGLPEATGGFGLQMLIMCSSNAGKVFNSLHESFPGKVGWLLSPGYWKVSRGWPFALDNGAYAAWVKKEAFDELAFYKHVEKGSALARFVVVPDVVANREATLESWERHFPRLKGLPLAFAVQDGMNPKDVPKESSVVFIGGTTQWKWLTARQWCQNFPRVHIARVNTRRQLLFAATVGAESTDGTGWFRGDQKQLYGLYRFLIGGLTKL